MPLTKLYSLPRQLYIAFFSSIIAGYVVHLYAFTNLIPNSDGINRVYDLQEMTVSGRWFLHYASVPHGFMQMPGFIAIVSLFFLGLTAALLVALLEIKSKPLAAVLGIVFVSFPSLGFTYLYMFTASAYSIGIFLAIFSVWLASKGGKCWFLAIIALAFSMGIYQAYAAFAIGLCVILVIKKTICPRLTCKPVTIFGVKTLLYLAAGAGLYYFLLKLILLVTGQELLPYLGMEQADYPLEAIPSLIFSAYKQVISFFFISGTGTTSIPLILGNLIVIGLGLIGLFFILLPFHKEKEPWRIAYVLILCCILPLAIGFSQLISPWSSPTPLMQYPYILAYGVVMFFIDNGLLRCPTSWKQRFALTTVLGFVFVSLGGAWLCNLLYTASAQGHRATESYVNRMMTQVEMTEGYHWDMPILVIGAFPEDRFHTDIPAYALIDHYAVPRNSVLPLNKHIYYYFNHWLNLPIEEPEEDTMIAMAEHPDFLAMPLYPDYGSVKIIEQQMVIKVGETYQEKSDYEIAYENKDKSS